MSEASSEALWVVTVELRGWAVGAPGCGSPWLLLED